MEAQERKWVLRWRYEIDPEHVAPGVWHLRSGGFLVRFRVADGKSAMRALPEATTVEDAIRIRSDLQAAAKIAYASRDPERGVAKLANHLRKTVASFDDMSPTDKGAVAEQVVAARLMQSGVRMSKPLTVERYDFIVDVAGTLLRLQVKTGIVRDGAVRFSVSSINYGGKTTSTYRGQVDAFAVFCPELDTVYFIPFDVLESAANTVSLRLKPSGVNGLLAETFLVRPLTRKTLSVVA